MPKLLIRNAEPGDLQALTDIYNDAILTTTATFDLEVKDLADRRKWFDSHGERHPILVGVVDGDVVGWSCLSPWSDRCAYDQTAETTLYVAAKWQGQGIGRQLKTAIIDEARRLKYHTLIARVAEGSDASLHLNLEFGFRMVGTLQEVGRKFGKILDVHILQLMLNADDRV
jgi:L-amino acid N-acyltransferase YncA